MILRSNHNWDQLLCLLTMKRALQPVATLKWPDCWWLQNLAWSASCNEDCVTIYTKTPLTKTLGIAAVMTTDRLNPQKGVTYHVVMKLLEGLQGKGFNLFLENWCSKSRTLHWFGKGEDSCLWHSMPWQERLTQWHNKHQGQIIKPMKRGQSVLRQKGILTYLLTYFSHRKVSGLFLRNEHQCISWWLPLLGLAKSVY